MNILFYCLLMIVLVSVYKQNVDIHSTIYTLFTTHTLIKMNENVMLLHVPTERSVHILLYS